MKYFVVSDIHGFYEELIESLNSKGYEKDNPNHTLVVLGDIFDRGREPIEVYNFLMSIPESNLVLVRGNHEDIFKDLLLKDYPDENDYYNGTFDTFCSIATYLKKDEVFETLKNAKTFYERWDTIKRIVKESEIAKFMANSPRWNNYYEIDNYVLVHGFIPTKDYENYDPNWRKVTSRKKWEDARWGYGFQYYEMGTFQDEIEQGKTLVCGHVSAREIRNHFGSITNNFDIYENDNFIAIDAHTVESHQVNVLVIEKE